MLMAELYTLNSRLFVDYSKPRLFFKIHAFLQVLFKPRPGGGGAAGAD